MLFYARHAIYKGEMKSLTNALYIDLIGIISFTASWRTSCPRMRPVRILPKGSPQMHRSCLNDDVFHTPYTPANENKRKDAPAQKEEGTRAVQEAKYEYDDLEDPYLDFDL